MSVTVGSVVSVTVGFVVSVTAGSVVSVTVGWIQFLERQNDNLVQQVMI